MYGLLSAVEFGGWSSEGCSKMSESNNTMTCSCSHLSTFALVEVCYFAFAQMYTYVYEHILFH